MDLKKEALEKYGVKLRLAGGGGPKENPFALEPCSALEATHTQLETLRLINSPRGFFYRLFEAAPAPEVGPRVQAVAFHRAHITEPDNKTTVACYFDHSAVHGDPHAAEPLYIWRDDRSPIMLPHELGWLHYSNFRDYTGPNAPLNQSCAYHGPNAVATIYVYAHGQPHETEEQRAELQAAEMQEVLGQVIADPRGYQPTHEPIPVGPFDLRLLSAGDESTMVAIACVRDCYVKARISYKTNPTVLVHMVQTVQDLAALIERQAPQSVQ